ncbi:MAG: hypothetical protein NC311_08955 [Muribaculaceae bacterium]|nr:hypothetical protein [Muribaculaceae bacterium]
MKMLEFIKSLFGVQTDVLTAFGTGDITSNEMRQAIASWIEEYFRRKPDKDSDPCQRLPYTIVHKLEKGMFAEYASHVLDRDSTDKGRWMAANLDALDSVRGAAMQWMLIAGEAWLKPVPERRPDGGIAFRPQIIHRDQAFVLGRAADGRITAIGTIEVTKLGSYWFTLTEKRSLDGSGLLTIENRLYRSRQEGLIGTRCPLSKVEQYAALPERFTYPVPMGGVGLVSLRTPLVNCVDGSAEAVSIYEPAMGLIHNANRNEAQINDEYELGQHRIVAPAEMLKDVGKDKHALADKVFVGVNEYQVGAGGLTAFSPELRHEAFEARKQSYLKSIENVIGMKRGLLSDVQEVEKTAYEIASTAGDYNLSLIDLQRIWFDAVREYLTLCDTLGQMYGWCGKERWDVTGQLAVTWGNGVLYDPDRQWQEDCEMVRMGFLRPEIALAHRYDLPWETEEDRARIREKYMPEQEALLSEIERLR